jgi:tRNA-dihydrouridine synthase
MEATMSPKMRIVWQVLEGAMDCRDVAVIAACRRLIVANRLGWRRHARPADWRFVQAFAE